MGFIVFLFRLMVVYWLLKLFFKGLIFFLASGVTKKSKFATQQPSTEPPKSKKKNIITAEFRETK